MTSINKAKDFIKDTNDAHTDSLGNENMAKDIYDYFLSLKSFNMLIESK